MVDFTANQVFVIKTLFPDLGIESQSDLLYQPNPYVPAVKMPLELFRNALKYEGRFRASESGHWVVNTGRRSGATTIASYLVRRGLSGNFPDVYYTGHNRDCANMLLDNIDPEFRSGVKERIIPSNPDRYRGMDLRGAYLIIDNASFHRDLDGILRCAVPAGCRIIMTGISNGKDAKDAFKGTAFQTHPVVKKGENWTVLSGAGLIDLSSFESGVVSPGSMIKFIGESQFKTEFGCGSCAW